MSNSQDSDRSLSRIVLKHLQLRNSRQTKPSQTLLSCSPTISHLPQLCCHHRNAHNWLWGHHLILEFIETDLCLDRIPQFIWFKCLWRWERSSRSNKPRLNCSYRWATISRNKVSIVTSFRINFDTIIEINLENNIK